MKRKLILLLAGLLAALSGCSLAQPEAREAVGDRFAGFFLVYDAAGSGRDAFYNNPNLTAFGSQTLDTEYGKLSLPRNVLVGKEGKDGQYTFPGMEGLCLFLFHGKMDDGSLYTKVVSDIGDSEYHVSRTDNSSLYAKVVSDIDDSEYHVAHTDRETIYEFSGTAYLGPPLNAGPDWDPYTNAGIMTCYRVYEAPDGTVYLDGTGNSISGGLGSYSEDRTFSTMEDGEMSSSETIKVTVHGQYAPRLEKLTVSQFDDNNTPLQADELALRDDLPEVTCLPETAWVLVEEQSADGTARTLYSAPQAGEEPSVTHSVVLLDDDGWGRTAALDIRFPACPAGSGALP